MYARSHEHATGQIVSVKASRLNQGARGGTRTRKPFRAAAFKAAGFAAFAYPGTPADRSRFVRTRWEHLFVYTEQEVNRVFRLLAAGNSTSKISRITTVSQRTIERWVATGKPSRALPDPERLLHERNKPAYAYLLGLYLGDGCLAYMHRGVFRLQLKHERPWQRPLPFWPDEGIEFCH